MAHIIWLDVGTPNKRAKVVWECRSLNGRKRQSKTFPPRTAHKDIMAFKRKMEDAYEKSEGVIYQKFTINDLMDRFLEIYGDTLSPSTYRGYMSSFYCAPHGIGCYLGQCDVKKIKTSDIQRYCNFLMKEGLAPKTCKNRIILIHTLLEKARKMGYRERYEPNPASDVELPKARKLPVYYKVKTGVD